MNFFDIVEGRRAVKSYEPGMKMPEEDFQKIMSAVILSPTSYNIQNWRFVRVTDMDLREKVKDAAWGQMQVKEASELLVLCADIDAWKDRPERYYADAAEEVKDAMLPMIHDFYHGKERIQRDEAMRSCGIAAQTLMLSAKAMGYDTCPMLGFNNEEVAKLVNLPDNHVVVMLVAMGTAKSPAYPRSGQLPLNEVLIENGF